MIASTHAYKLRTPDGESVQWYWYDYEDHHFRPVPLGAVDNVKIRASTVFRHREFDVLDYKPIPELLVECAGGITEESDDGNETH